VLAAAALTAPECPLSDREREVLRVAGPDRPTKQVAREVRLTDGTVRNHLSAAVAKLGVENRADAHRHATEQGWL